MYIKRIWELLLRRAAGVIAAERLAYQVDEPARSGSTCAYMKLHASSKGANGKPILEVNLRHQLIVVLGGLSDDERAFKEDAAHLLFDEARVPEGERPSDAGRGGGTCVSCFWNCRPVAAIRRLMREGRDVPC
jgi:hypothetical protein